MKCKRCNSFVPENANFCQYCGLKLESNTDYNYNISRTRTVAVERESDFRGALAVYQILCDGHVVGSVRNGDTTYFQIDENSHTVQCCKITPIHFDGEHGHGGTTISDVVVIPSGTLSAKLVVKPEWGSSLRLELKNLF